MMHEFCSIFIPDTVKQERYLTPWLVQIKFNITTFCLDKMCGFAQLQLCAAITVCMTAEL